MARPTKYKTEYDEQAYKLCLLGATDAEIADFFEVNEDTINEWKKVHHSFSESLKKGKEIADGEIAHKLYQRASGYNYEQQEWQLSHKTGQAVEVTIAKHIPPDVTACIFWLKNRQPKKWRDRNSLDIDFNKLQESDLDKIIETLIQRNEQQISDTPEQTGKD